MNVWAKTIAAMTAAILAVTIPLAVSSDLDSFQRNERNREAMENAIGPVLYPGGVARLYIVDSCSAGECPSFPQFRLKAPGMHATGLTAIRQIFRGDGRTAVTAGIEGIIRIRYGATPSSLLQTKIHSLRFSTLQRYNIIEAESALEMTPEVKAAVRKLGLETPITVISESIQEPMEGVPRLPREIHNVTLDQGLDLLAKTFGELVRYEECVRPDGSRCFSINQSYTQGAKWFDALRAPWDKLRQEGYRTGVCPVHRVSLRNTTIYEWSHSWDRVPPDPRPQDPPNQFFKREETYPMRLGYLERLTPAADFTKKKVKRFCPVCQRLFEADLKTYMQHKPSAVKPDSMNLAPRGDQ